MRLTAYLRFSAEHDHRIRYFDFIEPPSASPSPHQGHRPREAPALLLSDRRPARPGPGPKHGLTRCSVPAGQNLDHYPNHIPTAYMASGT